MNPQELDLFQHVAMTASDMIPKSFDSPDDDWAPMAFFEIEDSNQVPVMPLGPYMGSDNEKEMLARMILPGAVREFRAARVVLVFSVWSSKTSSEAIGDGSGPYLPPSEQEDRVEMVTVSELTAEGPKRYAFAKIIRHEDQPPELAEWEDADAGNFEGRFVDPIVKALKAVAA